MCVLFQSARTLVFDSDTNLCECFIDFALRQTSKRRIDRARAKKVAPIKKYAREGEKNNNPTRFWPVAHISFATGCGARLEYKLVVSRHFASAAVSPVSFIVRLGDTYRKLYVRASKRCQTAAQKIRRGASPERRYQTDKNLEHSRLGNFFREGCALRLLISPRERHTLFRSEGWW